MLRSEFLNGEHVIISDHLADLPLLTAVFALHKGKMFDGEILALFGPSSVTSGGYLFSRLFADLFLSAAFFSTDTGIYNSLSVSSVGFSFQFPWGRLPTSDGIKS
jgi:hypothetical protein